MLSLFRRAPFEARPTYKVEAELGQGILRLVSGLMSPARVLPSWRAKKTPKLSEGGKGAYVCLYSVSPRVLSGFFVRPSRYIGCKVEPKKETDGTSSLRVPGTKPSSFLVRAKVPVRAFCAEPWWCARILNIKGFERWLPNTNQSGESEWATEVILKGPPNFDERAAAKGVGRGARKKR